MFGKKRTKPKAEIPTASMADIAFLLIIFFMTTTTISKDKVTVELPTSLERYEVPKNAEIISIQKNGEVRVNGEVTPVSEIYPIAADAMAKNSEKFFIIKADTRVKFGLVNEVLEQLRLAGVKNLSFPTRQEIEK